MKRKKKLGLRILAGVGGFAIIAILLWALTDAVGNPIAAGIATYRVRAYVEGAHPEGDFEVSWATYDFKMGIYSAKVQSKSSPDTRFPVHVGGDGRIFDGYEGVVTARAHTLTRLNDELDRYVEGIVSEGFPHETRLVGASFKTGQEDLSRVLDLDMAFDPHDLPLPVAITVWSSADEPGYDILARRMLELKTLFEAAGLRVQYYSVSVEYPYEWDGSGTLVPILFDEAGVYEFPAQGLYDRPDLGEVIKAYREEYDAADPRKGDIHTVIPEEAVT